MKTLVAYFSCTGTTKKVAKEIAHEMKANCYEIKPQIPYKKNDLNWMDANARSTIEMKAITSRPKMIPNNPHIEDYDLILLGFPIWWYVAPTIINTFLESFDFSHKTVVLFATSGGSNFGKALENLQNSCSKTTTIKEGKVFFHPTKTDISIWINHVLSAMENK